jgi:hypothetical protein
MNGYDVAYKFLDMIQPYVGYILGCALFWLISYISDRSLLSIFKELLSEFGDLLERKSNSKSANALGLLLMFFLIVVLFHGRVGEMFLSSEGGGHGESLSAQGLNLFLVIVFGGAILLSLHISRYEQ